MSGKGKVALLIVAILLLSLLTPGLQADAKSKEEGASSGESKESDPGIFSFKKGSRTQALEWESSIFKVGGTTLLVLVLAGGVIFALSKIQKSPKRAGSKKALNLVETLRLGPRKRIHLAQVAHRTVVLAETDKEISLLLSLDEDDLEVEEVTGDPLPAGPAIPPVEVPFRNLLKAGAAGGGK